MARESLNSIATSIFDHQITKGNPALPTSDMVNRFLTSGSFGRKYNDGLITDLDSVLRIKSSVGGISQSVYDVGGYGHVSVDYGQSNALGGGVRPIAKWSLLTAEEKSWYEERGGLLDSKPVSDQKIKKGFMFDINDSNIGAQYDTSSMVPGLKDAIDRTIAANIITAGKERAYVSASLTEFLLALLSDSFGPSLKIQGIFGLERQNDTPRSSGAAANAITDHAFGRAFDFSQIQKTAESGSQPSPINTAKGHVEQLMILLEKMNAMPPYLIPDFIAVSAKYVDQSYDTYESKTNQLWAKYTNLRYLKLKRDTSGVHDNHIHISFSPARGGIYVGPNGLLYNSATASKTSSTSQSAINKILYATSPYGSMPTNILTKDFTGNTQSPTPEQVFVALVLSRLFFRRSCSYICGNIK